MSLLLTTSEHYILKYLIFIEPVLRGLCTQFGYNILKVSFSRCSIKDRRCGPNGTGHFNDIRVETSAICTLVYDNKCVVTSYGPPDFLRRVSGRPHG